MVKSAVDGTRRMLVSAAIVGMLAGCAVGQDFRRPDPPAASTYLPGAQPSETVAAKGPGGAKQRFDIGTDIPSEWWLLFRAESLDRLGPLPAGGKPGAGRARATPRAGPG